MLDAQGVGHDLQDHMQVRIVTRCTQKITLNDTINNPVSRVMAGVRYALTRSGPLTIAAGTSGAFFKTNPRLASPDIQIHFIPFSTDKMGEKLHPFSGFTASVCQLRPVRPSAASAENASSTATTSSATPSRAAPLLCRHACSGGSAAAGAVIVTVDDAFSAPAALGRAAASASPGVLVVGITGSSGKTGTKDLTAGAARPQVPHPREPGQLQQRDRAPVHPARRAQRHRGRRARDGRAVFPGNIADLCAIACPDVGVITNIGLSHAGCWAGRRHRGGEG